MEKQCKKCSKYKRLEKFHKHKNGKFGRHSVCKICRKNIEKKYNPDEKRKCNICEEILDSSKFYKNKNNKTGLSSHCKKCYLDRRSKNQSKLENYIKIMLKKFKRKHKVSFDAINLLRVFNCQQGRCYISKHKMTHSVDKKGRTDNIWNASILPINDKDILDISDVRLVTNFFYSVKKKYKLNTREILNISEAVAE